MTARDTTPTQYVNHFYTTDPNRIEWKMVRRPLPRHELQYKTSIKDIGARNSNGTTLTIGALAANKTKKATTSSSKKSTKKATVAPYNNKKCVSETKFTRTPYRMPHKGSTKKALAAMKKTRTHRGPFRQPTGVSGSASAGNRTARTPAPYRMVRSSK